jgi:hypothetical protein
MRGPYRGTHIAPHPVVRTLLTLMVLSVALVTQVAGADRLQYVWLHGFDGHGRTFDLRSLRGQVVVLTFGSRATRDEVSEVNDELARLAEPGEVRVVSVVDMEGIPNYANGMARKKIAESDREGRLQHVVDDQGTLKRSFGVDPQRQVDIFVIDKSGALRGRFTGDRQVDEVAALVDELR